MCPSMGFYHFLFAVRVGGYSWGGLVSMETDIPLKVLGSHCQLLSLGNGSKFSVKCLRG